MHFIVFLAFLASACAAGFAISAAVRAGRSLSRWSFAAGMAVLASEALMAGLGGYAHDLGQTQEWQQRRLFAQSFVPVVWLLFSLTYARGNGRQCLARAAAPLTGAIVLTGFGLITFRIALVPLAGSTAVADPAHLFRLQWSGIVFYALYLLGAVGVVLNLERTFRAAVGTVRWRIKFMLLGAGVIFVARIYTSSQMIVFHAIDPALDSINFGAIVIATPLLLRSFFRAGHFDLDVYPSQAVLQSSITVLLAGVYLLLIGTLARAVTYFGGNGAFASKAFLVLVALVALALVLQSDRARQYLRRFVSRHFQRPLYDYRTVWNKFTAATTSRVDQADLARATTALVADIFQALSVSLWIAGEKRDTLVLLASTASRGPRDARSGHEAWPAAAVIAHFQAHPEPVDIETEAAAWAVTLRELHPAQFSNGGRRSCVPLISHGEVLGVLTIGDRVGGAPLSFQDFEMLKCAADHTAANLMNVLLAQRLAQAKELEAFQAMAAFFVHDLKNAASTLNLLLQNLPVLFDNPEFRADTLRAISHTVTHVNQLVSRLGQLRHELEIELNDADLNQIVTDALAALSFSVDTTLTTDIQPLPRIRLDGEQLNKVVTNLVLNAAEAVSGHGQVRVATSQQNGWAVLTVDDNGCGMSDEFVARSLFRPFQTTKKSGLGIGMFQSKMIVEAHGGRITVASKPGTGTTFQVFLRVPPPAN